MGLKQGIFYSHDGDEIAVSFYGEKVVTGDIKMAATPVVIQMDGGGGEYTPVQYATASIGCETTGVGLLDLCTKNPLDVAVEVYNRTKESVLFAGYVTPNIFNQPIDGINATMVIECVDWLGIAKYIPYTRSGNEYRAITIREIVLDIISRITTECDVAMGQYVEIADDQSSTNKYYELVLSEAYFVNTPTDPTRMPDGSYSLLPTAITCYEVLAMIAETFRGSWVQTAQHIVLNDILSPASFFNLTKGLSENLSKERTVNAEAISSSGSTISILPQYSQFSLRRKIGAITLTPEVLAAKNLNRNGERITDHFRGESGNRTVYLVQLLTSSFISLSNETTLPWESKPTAMLLGVTTVNPPSLWNENAPEWFTQWSNDWTNYIRISCPKTESPSDYVDVVVNKEYCGVALASQYAAVKLDIDVAIANAGPQPIRDAYEKDEQYDEAFEEWRRNCERLKTEYYPEDLLSDVYSNVLLRVRVKSGDKCYDAVSGQWTSGDVFNSVSVMGKGQAWKTGKKTLTDTCITGPVEITLRFYRETDSETSVYFIRKLKLTFGDNKYVDKALYYHPVQETSYRGIYEFNNVYDVVEQPITFGVPMTERTFSSVIDGVDYTGSQSTGGESFRITGDIAFVKGGTRYSMLERIERMANFGDRKEYTFNLKDPHNAISPLDTFTSSLWIGNKVCVAYQRDIEQNTINITLD